MLGKIEKSKKSLHCLSFDDYRNLNVENMKFYEVLFYKNNQNDLFFNTITSNATYC